MMVRPGQSYSSRWLSLLHVYESPAQIRLWSIDVRELLLPSPSSVCISSQIDMCTQLLVLVTRISSAFTVYSTFMRHRFNNIQARQGLGLLFHTRCQQTSPRLNGSLCMTSPQCENDTFFLISKASPPHQLSRATHIHFLTALI